MGKILVVEAIRGRAGLLVQVALGSFTSPAAALGVRAWLGEWAILVLEGQDDAVEVGKDLDHGGSPFQGW